MNKGLRYNTPIGEIKIIKNNVYGYGYGYLVYIKCIDVWKDFKSIRSLENFISATKGLPRHKICCKHRQVSDCSKCCRYDTCNMKKEVNV